MQIKIIPIIFFLIINFSCDNLPISTGTSNALTVVVSDEDRDLVLLYLEPILYEPVYTPTIENLYDINIISAQEFKKNNLNKNIIITSLINPSDLNVDLLSNKIATQYNNQNIFSLYNLFAKDQLVVNMRFHNDIEFQKELYKNKEWLKNEINDNIEKNILNKINNSLLEDTIIKEIEKKFSINLLIDENYKIIKNHENFLWIGRGLPYRWIIINQIDKDKINSDDYITFFRTELTSKLSGVNILDYNLNKSYKNGNLRVRGIYEHLDSDTGGPFFTYIFDKIVNEKIIFISGFVNNPGKSKANLLLQLETIINNIGVLNE
jgi:hypothetical protein